MTGSVHNKYYLSVLSHTAFGVSTALGRLGEMEKAKEEPLDESWLAGGLVWELGEMRVLGLTGGLRSQSNSA